MFATESQTKTEDQPPTLAEIIREVTNNGQTIIDFFHDAMNGRLDGFEPCHRIAAARELAKRGDKQAIAFLQSFYPKSNRRKPSPAIGEALPDHELAEIVREVTGDGRTIVHFLHDAMQGILYGFKACHRVACGKELLRRGFDIIPADYDHDEYEDHDDVQQCHDEPFDHKKYAREQFWRDGADGKALEQIYGSEEAVSAALSAVRTHRRKTVLADAHIPDLDYTPIENPEDDPYGKGCFGYDTLRLSFNDNQAIRAANKAVEEFKKRMAKHLKKENGGPPAMEDTAPPDHRTLQYLERSRHLLSEENGKPPKDPYPPSSVIPERPQNPPVGAGFKPARGLAHPSTKRHSDPAEEPPAPAPPSSGESPADNVEPEPDHSPIDPDPGGSEPRQKTRAKARLIRRRQLIFTGPPDEDPR